MSELRQVLRGLRKQPLHTAAAVLAFGLAIAANTAIFSAADALLFHPIDLPEIDRLVMIHDGAEGTKFGDIRVTPADYFDVRDLVGFGGFPAIGPAAGRPHRQHGCHGSARIGWWRASIARHQCGGLLRARPTAAYVDPMIALRQDLRIRRRVHV